MPDRSRTYGWKDPAILASARLRMSGIEFLKAWAAGELPRAPIEETLEFDLTEVGEGEATFRGRPAEYLHSPLGGVHGSYFAALLDAALGCAIESTLPAGVGYTTLELKVNMIRPITKDTGEVVAKGRLLHAGRRIATSEARLLDRHGNLLAHGSTTCLLFTT